MTRARKDKDFDDFLSIQGWDLGQCRAGSRMAMDDETVLIFRGDNLEVISGDHRFGLPERVVRFLIGVSDKEPE